MEAAQKMRSTIQGFSGFLILNFSVAKHCIRFTSAHLKARKKPLNRYVIIKQNSLFQLMASDSLKNQGEKKFVAQTDLVFIESE